MKTKKSSRTVYILTMLSILCFIFCSLGETIATETIDNAPVVIVEDISQLPQSMLNNIKKSKNKNAEKESLSIAQFPQEYYNKVAEKSSIKSIEKPMYLEKLITRNIIENIIMGIVQEPQELDNYCGYACLQSLLEYHGIFKEQHEIAQDAYDTDDALAWFAGTQALATNVNYYPAAVYLNTLLSHNYTPYNLYFGPFNSSIMFNKIKSTIDAEEGVLVCGISKGDNSNGSKLPNYPESDIGHWIIVDGYLWNTSTQSGTGLSYVDPAKSAAITWSPDISAYGETTIENIYNFASAHGIIY